MENIKLVDINILKEKSDQWLKDNNELIERNKTLISNYFINKMNELFLKPEAIPRRNIVYGDRLKDCEIDFLKSKGFKVALNNGVLGQYYFITW